MVPTTVGTNTRPDVMDTAKELGSNSYSNNVDEKKLVPSTPWHTPGTEYRNTNFREMMKSIVNAVQDVRGKITEPTKVQFELDSMQKAMDNVHLYRRKEHATKMLEAIKGDSKIVSNGIQIMEKDVGLPDGSKFSEFDADKTTSSEGPNKGKAQEFLDAAENFPKTWEQDRMPMKHANALAACVEIKIHLAGPCGSKML